jgi:hypothetical protein
VIRVAFAAVGLIAAALLLADSGRASLYQPDDPMAVPVRPDGTGEALPFGEFKRRLAVLNNAADPRPTKDGQPNPDRAKYLARVKAQKSPRGLPPLETAALAADMIRLGNTDAGFYVNDALDLLFPRTRDRSPNYFVLTTMAQIHLLRDEQSEAIARHQAALLDSEMPEQVKSWTKEQRDWIKKLDEDYVLHYYHIRRTEKDNRGKAAPEDEEPTSLFPLPQRGASTEPVRFVNDAGQYEPGKLAAAEQAKLPPDAIAIVQQLLLWFPTDTRLYWLLGELYAANGELDSAQKILDECAWSRQYGNRKLLMEHRGAITNAAEQQRLAAAKAAENALPISMQMIWIYFGAVAVIAALAAVRIFTRRGKGRGLG